MSEDQADYPGRDARFLRAFLADRDAECPKCQYNLRNLMGNRCPECGERIVVRVNLVEPKLGAMIAGLVGLSAGAGFSGLLLIYMVIRSCLEGGFPGGIVWSFFWHVVPGFVIEGLFVVLWISKWRDIRRFAAGRRSILVIGCWASTLTNIVMFSIKMK